MTERISVRPELLRWACARGGKDIADYAGRFPKLEAWLRADAAPTLKQLEQFAAATHTPLGYLLLEQPPAEEVPIPDFRTIAARDLRRPSPDLLETIYVCQQRQEWYREFARTHGATPLAFAGSARVTDVSSRRPSACATFFRSGSSSSATCRPGRTRSGGSSAKQTPPG